MSPVPFFIQRHDNHAAEQNRYCPRRDVSVYGGRDKIVLNLGKLQIFFIT